MKNVVLLLLISLSFLMRAQSVEEWKLRVSDKVFEQFEDSDTVEYLVQLAGKADLSLAKTLYDKNEKAEYVYKTLKLYAESDQMDIIDLLRYYGVKYKAFFIVNAILVKSDYRVMSQIAQLSKVKFIEANPSVRQERPVPVYDISLRDSNSVTWGLGIINADDVWDMGYTGAGVVVGGQDTGYRWTHEAIKSRYRGWNGTDADHNYNWHDAIHENDTNNSGNNPCGYSINEPCDDNGHGTHTMGTMVGLAGTNEIGVAPDAKWIGCRNMERGRGTPSTYIECFEWFLAPTDTTDSNPNSAMAPDVINNSWYCPASEGCDNSNYSTMEDAVNNLRDAGVVVVVSAGNSGSNCSTINTPPNFFSSSFDVGATNSMDTIAGFSSRGPTTGYGSSILKPNISAPGVSVKSSTYDSDSSYGLKSGTSMAGPHVAGAVALLISAYPALKGNPDDIENILEQSADFLETTQECGGIAGTEIPNNTYGYGRLDILDAINYSGSLPLNTVSFSGEKYKKNKIKLSYEIEVMDMDKIELQRSNNGILWEDIAELDFEGEYIDDNPVEGINYYRLKIFSLDGDFILSKVISVNSDSYIKFVNYPSILKRNGNINFIVNDPLINNISISIFDYIGRNIVNKSIRFSVSEKTVSIPVNNASKGVYFLVVKDEDTGKYIGKSKFIVVE